MTIKQSKSYSQGSKTIVGIVLRNIACVGDEVVEASASDLGDVYSSVLPENYQQLIFNSSPLSWRSHLQGFIVGEVGL